MINLSMREAVLLYSELVEAYHGVNGFGGTTAELYMYRLGFSANAWADLTLPTQRAAEVRQANESLYNLIEFFVENYRMALILVNHTEFGAWVKDAGFEHRVHVRVEKTK